MNSKLLPHLALLGANLLYGANYTIAKKVMPNFIEPFGFIFIRVSCAALFFWFIHLFAKQEKIERSDFIRLFFCGMFGVAINQLCFFKGLDITTPINASLIMITTPILVFIIAVLAKKETLTWYKSLGILIGASGALFIILGKNFSFSSETALGDLLILINATSYGIYLTIVKPLMKKYGPITVIKWVFLFGFVPVFFVGQAQFMEIEWLTFTPKIWMATAFVVLGVTCGAYLFNIYAISKLNPSTVGIYIYLQPLIATVVALLLHEDVITKEKVFATIFIFLGVYLVSFYRPKLKKVI